MSYSPSFASLGITRGQFPPTVRTFVWKPGTLGNLSFLSIAFNTDHPTGAMVVVNELMSFETALLLAKNLDPVTPHRLDRLAADQRTQILAMPRGPATLSADELGDHFLPEPDAEYLNRFDKEWRDKVLHP